MNDMRPSVLIIDDDERWRFTLRNIFDGFGFRIVEAEKPGDALEAVASEYFDLILVDVKLANGATGLDVIEAIRRRALKTGFIAVVTGYPGPSLAVSAMKAGG